MPFRVFTNGSANPPAAYAKSLRAAGLYVPDDHMMIVVLRDDPFLETRMARVAGAIGVGVTTGLATRDIWAAQTFANRAPHVIDGFTPLLGFLGNSMLKS
ncbi:HAD family hydrolase [Rhizorhapis suberifaciens]|uniref:Phosphoglycolate phosphatase-like HAD superfamily hydrolase n=1 Tax=Rhizorhapis suberifaciens TaxID=13656 RepID=A0A840HR64_9SPHN|nr:hypothetical protein [Rhizorhapis suberifaciens]MBB4640415.1 phosphoglycolate phosphatase-like HAD superfamily hydrolase [Rhizorhapis suberifaciens]